MASTSTATPRRKFNITSEVAMALRRYQLQKDNEWTTKLDKSIVTTICQAYRSKFLYVGGSNPSYFLPIYNMQELLEYMKVLPEPKPQEEVTGKHLKSIPLFYVKKFPNKTNGNQTEKTKVPLPELLTLYKWAENHHKRTEGHHPDGLGWAGGVPATMECVLDVFNSLLRTHTLHSAYLKLFTVLNNSKFDNLDIQGVFYAFLHISIRGVANSEFIYKSGDWRRSPISQELLFKVCRDFATGLQPRSLISSYVYETHIHAACLKNELYKLRFSNTNHDFTKFDSRMIYAYAWYWGVYQRFEDVNKYRFNAGIYNVVNVDLTLQGSPTMMTLGSSLGQGLATSPAVHEIISLLKDLPQHITAAVDNSVEKIGEKLDKTLSEQQDVLHKNVGTAIDEIAEKQKKVGEDLIDKIVEKSTAIGKNMFTAFEPAMEALKSFTSMIEDIIQKVCGVLAPFPGFSNIKLNSRTIFDALTYYIMFINTESTALKTIMIVLILNTFGLLKTAFSEILNFWSWLNESVELGGETVPAGETSGIFSWLSSAPHALVQAIGGIIASMIKGSALTSKEFLSLAKKLAETLKSFHFISQGITGITKIFEYCKKAYSCVVEWISVHIFGKTPELSELALRVTRLTIKVKYLHSEAGLNAIRMSESVRADATRIMPEYLALQIKLREKPLYRQMYIDLDKINRQVKEISDFVTRLNNLSNFQPTMFHIQFVGRPGIGKSTITKNVVNDLSKSLWPEDSKPSFYSYNTDLEYFDGYAGQKIMIVDDLFKINDPKHLTASMFLVTNTPVILPMANLNDKGVQLTSEVLLTSTNTAYPIGKDVLCMEAIHRRRHMLVEVICDPDVLDTSLGQFSMPLFRRKYSGQNPEDFPHLTFNLLRPVPKEFGGAASSIDDDEFSIYKHYAEELKAANIHVALADKKLDPTYYFSEDNRPPPGIQLPTTGWTYQQFISNCVVRFRTFRGAEGSYTSQRKYAHVETCLAEIDMILNQENHIPDGTEIAVNKIIEDLFCKAQHPYGSQDPIGERLYERGRNPAPELDQINIDEIVNNVTSENAPTVLTTDEELARTRAILRRRNRTIIDPILKDMLRVEQIQGRSYVPITSHYSGWYLPPAVASEDPAQWLAALKTQGYLSKVTVDRELINESTSTLYIMYFLMTRIPPQCAKDLNEILRWIFGAKMYFPDNDCFPESLRGQCTKFPINFFKDMEKINGRWYLDVTQFENCSGLKPININMTPYLDGPVYEVRADIALMLSTMPMFREFVAHFEGLTTAQQDLLVEDACWRNSYTGSYTYDRIYQDCTNIFSKIAYKTMHYCTNPFRYIAEHYPLATAIVAYFIAYFAVIYTIQTISNLFSPKPTSKVLHRAPQASLIGYGRPTAQDQAVCQFAQSVAERNVREIILSDGTGGYKIQGLLTQQYIICNKHAFRYLTNDKIRVDIRSPNKELIGYMIERKNVWMDPDGDLAIIYSPAFPCARKITQYFMTNQEYLDHELGDELVLLSNINNVCMVDHHRCLGRYQKIKLRNANYENSIDKAVLVQGMTAQGRSGSTVMTWRTARPRIVGIQAWEVDPVVSPKIAIQVVTTEVYENLVAQLNLQLGIVPVERIMDPDLTEVEGLETATAFAQVPAQHIINQDPHQVGIVGRSLIKPSIITEELRKHGIVSKSCPAALSPYDRRLYHGTQIHPLAHSIGKYFRGNIEPFDIDLIGYSRRQLGKYIKSRLDKVEFKTLGIEEIVVGTREDGSNPMNLKSSPGLPFIHEKVLRGKKDYMEIDEFGNLSYIDNDFQAGFYDFLQLLKNRQIPYTCAYDFPKDELRPIDKALGTQDSPPKTRSVTCMNVYYIMAWRHALLDFWAAMHRAADGTFTFCPGINPEGPDWNSAYHYLNQHPNAVDFDITNWDGHLRADLFLQTIELVKETSGINKETCNIVDSIAFDVINSFIQYGNIIYTKDRGILSGFPGTAEINTLSHWLLFLYLYMLITRNTLYNTFGAFIKHVSVLIYGDDIIITFSNEIAPIFNGTTIASAYKNIGYPVTSASKSQEIEHSKSLLDCVFLKSSWRELISNYFVRAIDTSVIDNLLLWVRAKQDPINQFYDNYLDALWLAFSNGKECFERYQKIVNSALIKQQKDIVVFDYFDFERDYFRRYLPALVNNYISYASDLRESTNNIIIQ